MRRDRPFRSDRELGGPRIYADAPPLVVTRRKPGLLERIRQWHDRRQYRAPRRPPA